MVITSNFIVFFFLIIFGKVTQIYLNLKFGLKKKNLYLEKEEFKPKMAEEITFMIRFNVSNLSVAKHNKYIEKLIERLGGWSNC